jgi:hypothetical protein
LLIAETKIMSGRGEEAIEQLFLLRQWLANTTESTSTKDRGDQSQNTEMCSLRVQCSIINVHIRLRQWRLAVLELNTVLKMINKSISCNETEASDLSSSWWLIACKVVLSCLLSRLLLQVVELVVLD